MAAREGDFTTQLGCRIRVLNVTRDDGLDALLALTMPDNDGRHAEVLLSAADRAALGAALKEVRD